VTGVCRWGQVTLRDQALRPGGVYRRIVGGDRGQPVDVPVEHAKRGRDQHRVVNLDVRRAGRAGLGDVLGGNGMPAAGYRRAYAEQGFPVTEAIQESWAAEVARLKDHSESVRVFLPGGKPPKVGDLFKNPDIGHALRLIAEQGPSAFYKGEIARAILSTSQSLGGTMAADDLAEFSPEWVEPISTTYRGWTVYELPPNGQGMAALEMLNILETSPASPDGPLSVAELHKRIEAMKLAYADLGRYNADPRFAKVPVKGILSKEYARERAQLIDPGKANCDVPPGVPPTSDTTYLSVVDREGNIVSLIQSNYSAFGSGIADSDPPRQGDIRYQNRT